MRRYAGDPLGPRQRSTKEPSTRSSLHVPRTGPAVGHRGRGPPGGRRLLHHLHHSPHTADGHRQRTPVLRVGRHERCPSRGHIQSLAKRQVGDTMTVSLAFPNGAQPSPSRAAYVPMQGGAIRQYRARRCGWHRGRQGLPATGAVPKGNQGACASGHALWGRLSRSRAGRDAQWSVSRVARRLDNDSDLSWGTLPVRVASLPLGGVGTDHRGGAGGACLRGTRTRSERGRTWQRRGMGRMTLSPSMAAAMLLTGHSTITCSAVEVTTGG